jgi:spermidine/putrescine transport system ATP-binding protein
MSRGVLEQVGDGRTIYDQPATPFVASFVGETNRFAGRVVAAADGEAAIDTSIGRLIGRNPRGLGVGAHALLFVRPERMVPAASGGGDGRTNVIESRVTRQDFEGSFVNVVLAGPDAQPIIVQTTDAAAPLALAAGTLAAVTFRPADAVVLPAPGEVS